VFKVGVVVCTKIKDVPFFEQAEKYMKLEFKLMSEIMSVLFYIWYCILFVYFARKSDPSFIEFQLTIYWPFNDHV